MKKYKLKILSIFVLSFVLLGPLGFYAKTVTADDYGYGCTSAGPYNIITGQLCDDSQYNYPVYSYGCTSAGPFNIITGQLCSGAVPSNIYPYYNQPPIISRINGPQSLNVNQIGTWTVTVSNSNLYSGNLTYSVNWGDQPIYAYGVNSSYVYPPQQNATFTHTYTQAGTYTPVFTVTNSSGQSSSTSLSIVVSGYTSSTPPFISSISVSYGKVGTHVTIYGRGFSSTNICNTYPCTNNSFSFNTINFGLSIIPNSYSSDGTSLTFTVPVNTNSACLYTTSVCVIPQYQIIPGSYPIFVTNINGTSNVVNFTVTY